MAENIRVEKEKERNISSGAIGGYDLILRFKKWGGRG